jgi:hypothetical protein
MALRSTQPLTEMSTMYLPGGKMRSERKADNLAAICEPIIYKMWESQRLTTLWAFTASYRGSLFSFTFALKRNGFIRYFCSMLHLSLLRRRFLLPWKHTTFRQHVALGISL